LENENIDKILKNIKQKRALEEGDVIVGVVVQTTDKIAIINIDYKNQHVLSPSSSGVLFINNVSDGYIDKMGDIVRIGDIVRAKIIEKDKFGFKLAINEEDLGVIKSNCYNCKAELQLTSNSIKCLKCKTINLKKIAKM
jgi:exosome complex component CSL4